MSITVFCLLQLWTIAPLVWIVQAYRQCRAEEKKL